MSLNLIIRFIFFWLNLQIRSVRQILAQFWASLTSLSWSKFFFFYYLVLPLALIFRLLLGSYLWVLQNLILVVVWRQPQARFATFLFRHYHYSLLFFYFLKLFSTPTTAAASFSTLFSALDWKERLFSVLILPLVRVGLKFWEIANSINDYFQLHFWEPTVDRLEDGLVLVIKRTINFFRLWGAEIVRLIFYSPFYFLVTFLPWVLNQFLLGSLALVLNLSYFFSFLVYSLLLAVFYFLSYLGLFFTYVLYLTYYTVAYLLTLYFYHLSRFLFFFFTLPFSLYSILQALGVVFKILPLDLLSLRWCLSLFFR